MVQGHAQKHRVDVGCHHLAGVGRAGRPAEEHTFPGKDPVDHGGAARPAAVGPYKVAHGGQVDGAAGLKAQLARYLRRQLSRLIHQAIQPLFLGQDPADAQVFTRGAARILPAEAVVGHVNAFGCHSVSPSFSAWRRRKAAMCSSSSAAFSSDTGRSISRYMGA